jgi:hypothetical protein
MKITNCSQTISADKCSVSISDAEKSFLACVTVSQSTFKWDVRLQASIKGRNDRDLAIPFTDRMAAAKFAAEEVENLLAWMIP